jgi:Exonuclease I
MPCRHWRGRTERPCPIPVNRTTMPDTFLFYDLETFGQDPRRTRIAQFAAVRTDAELRQVEEPVSFFVRPADDLLPSPVATLVTGITPQRAMAEGVSEAEAFARITELMSRPQTCTLGYNTLRFDDEFVRCGLFRNFYDPYEREWRGGNSRWDLLDMLRLVHALRPEGIHWPQRDDGATSFKLEHLALANDVREGDAHEALSDVYATIGMARASARRSRGCGTTPCACVTSALPAACWTWWRCSRCCTCRCAIRPRACARRRCCR